MSMAREQDVAETKYETYKCFGCGQENRGRRIVEVSEEEYVRFKQPERSDNFLRLWVVVMWVGAVFVGIFAGMITSLTASDVPLDPWAILSWPELAALWFAWIMVFTSAVLMGIGLSNEENAKRHGIEEWKKRHGIPSEENISVRLAHTS